MIAQFISDSLIKYRKANLLNKIIEKGLLLLRKFYLSIDENALITYNLLGLKIKLTLKHDFPFNRKLFPEYDMNIGRIPGYLLKKYPNMQAIDIGANVGDTSIIIRHFAEIPIICIEPDNSYFNLLEKNTSVLPDIVYENCFIGESESEDLQFVNYTGSGRLIINNEPSIKIIFNTLIEIIGRHPNYNNVKYLKIDTDGFDSKIIRSNINFLEKYKPVIFFEHDPYLLGLVGDDGISVFNVLRNLGYEKVLIYDNLGIYLISLSLQQTNCIEELNLYFYSPKSDTYMDICVFHSEDSDVADKIRSLEIDYYRHIKK